MKIAILMHSSIYTAAIGECLVDIWFAEICQLTSCVFRSQPMLSKSTRFLYGSTASCRSTQRCMYLYGKHVIHLWCAYDMWYTCDTRVVYMLNQCGERVIPMSWCAYDTYPGCGMHTHVVCMWYPCCVHVIPMWHACDTHLIVSLPLWS